MKELVGTCSSCGRPIYCSGGVLEGWVREDQSMECFSCSTMPSPPRGRLQTIEEVKDMNERYPIGPFQPPAAAGGENCRAWTAELARLTERLEELAEGLTEEQWNTPYRDNGWTARQVFHHLADAFMNSYIHFKLALSEDNPTIKPYDEAGWVEQADEAGSGPALSLLLLKAVMDRWQRLLQSMQDADYARTFVHPVNGQKKLGAYLAFCAWHGKHHLAQIEAALGRGVSG